MTRHFSVDVEVKEKAHRGKRISPKATPKFDNISIKYEVKSLNESQRQFMFAFQHGLNVFAYGSAGTGKSFLACYLALNELLSGKKEKIIIVRSAVETRGVGFLPGNIIEKTIPYTIPYKQLVDNLCENGTAWEILTKKGMVEFITTSFIRGLTFDNCIVIVDEVQNMNFAEWNSLMTRLGKTCQIILCGDSRQNDLLYKKTDVSGFDRGLKILQNMPKFFDCIEFLPKDIVRSEIVKEWVIQTETPL